MRYTISEMAVLLGVTTHTLRYYEKMGLIQPEVNRETGYRYYTAPATRRSLTTAGSTVRTAWAICFIEMKFNIIRRIIWIRNATVLQRSIMVQILEIFCKSKTNTLYKAAVEVAFYKKSVHDGTYVSHTGEFFNFNFTCFCINSNFGRKIGYL